MFDLVLKAQGLSPKPNVQYYTSSPKILIDFAYLAPMKFKIAEFLRENPNSTAKQIRLHLGVVADTMSNYVGQMFLDGQLNRREIKAVRPHYSYTLAMRDFKINTGIKKINKNEINALNCFKDLGEFTSVDISYQTDIPQIKVFFLVRTLTAKGMIEHVNKDKSKHVFFVTTKGRNTLERGGIYEQGS